MSTLCEICLTTSALYIIQPDLSTATSVRVADKLAVVSDVYSTIVSRNLNLAYVRAKHIEITRL